MGKSTEPLKTRQYVTVETPYYRTEKSGSSAIWLKDGVCTVSKGT